MSLKENKHYFNCPAGATFSERSLRKSVDPNKEFFPGSDYQNILEDTTPEEFIVDIWDLNYRAEMLFFYPMKPGDPCPNPIYCP